MISWWITLIGLLIIAFLVISELTKKIDKLKKENKMLSQEYQVVYKQLKQAERLKEELNTGIDVNDFDNSISILSDLSKRSS